MSDAFEPTCVVPADQPLPLLETKFKLGRIRKRRLVGIDFGNPIHAASPGGTIVSVLLGIVRATAVAGLKEVRRVLSFSGFCVRNRIRLPSGCHLCCAMGWSGCCLRCSSVDIEQVSLLDRVRPKKLRSRSGRGPGGAPLDAGEDHLRRSATSQTLGIVESGTAILGVMLVGHGRVSARRHRSPSQSDRTSSLLRSGTSAASVSWSV